MATEYYMKFSKLLLFYYLIFIAGIVVGQEKIKIEDSIFEMEIKSDTLFLNNQKEQIILAIDKEWYFESNSSLRLGLEDTSEIPGIQDFPKPNLIKSVELSKSQHLLLLSFYSAPSDARIARGLDVLLSFNTKTKNFTPLSKDFIKTRIGRGWGPCRNALNYIYLLQDIDNDGLTDLGVLMEQITCDFENDVPSKPYYKQDAIKWYVNMTNTANCSWLLNQNYEGELPENYMEFKSLTTGPVDVVGKNLWKTNNRLEWPSTMPKGSIVVMKKP